MGILDWLGIVFLSRYSFVGMGGGDNFIFATGQFYFFCGEGIEICMRFFY
jgi:hypothetical protein